MELLFLNLGTQEMLILFIGGIGLLPLILTIIAVVDIFKRDFTNKSTDRLLLIVLLFVAPLIGTLIYLFALRKNYPLKSAINTYENI